MREHSIVSAPPSIHRKQGAVNKSHRKNITVNVQWVSSQGKQHPFKNNEVIIMNCVHTRSTKLSSKPILRGKESHSHASSWRGSQSSPGTPAGYRWPSVAYSRQVPQTKGNHIIRSLCTQTQCDTPTQLSFRFCYQLRMKCSVFSSRSTAFWSYVKRLSCISCNWAV